MLKNKFLKMLTVLMSIFFIGLAVSGCGSNRKKSEWKIVDVTDDSIPETYEAGFGNGATISYSGPDSWYAQVSLADNLPVWKKVQENLNIKIKWEVLPSVQWNTSMITKINSGRVLPDILGLPNWHNANINKFAKEGVIIPLNELINRYAPNIKRLLIENPEYRKQITAADGGIYSIDEFFEANHYCARVAIRKDWLDRLGLDIPVTVEDFENVMKAFKEKDANGNGDTNDEIPLYVSQSYKYDYFASGFGLTSPLENTSVREDGTVFYMKATDEYGKLLEWLNKLYVNSYIDGRFQAGNTTSFESEIARNTVGITVCGGDEAEKYSKMLRSWGDITAEYILIDPPCDKNGNITLLKKSITGGQIGISADCKDPVLAIKIMDYLFANEEGSRLIRYGLEGVTYNMVDDKPVFTDFVLNNPDGLDAGSALRSVGGWSPLFDHQTVDFLSGFFTPQANAYYKSTLDRGILKDPFPEVMATEEETRKAASLVMDFDTYQAEMTMKYILGTEKISNYSSYQAKMYTLGLREYEELRQAQYNRYLEL